MDYVALAEQGKHPLLLTKMESGFAVLANTQFLPGYCILLASPRVDHLTDLPLDQRTAYLRDMSLIGEALMDVCGPHGLRRVNYEILGNTDTYLHAHIIPRYEWEPPELIGRPAFNYPPGRWSDEQYHYQHEEHATMRSQLTEALQRRVEALR